MVDHNAETNRVPRRIYVYASERAIRCARISISIDIYPARGLRSTSREGTGPIVRLTNIVAPATCLRTTGISSRSLASLVLLIRLCFCHFLFSNVARSTGSKENATRGGTMTRGISGLANLVTKWLLRVSLVTRSI